MDREVIQRVSRVEFSRRETLTLLLGSAVMIPILGAGGQPAYAEEFAAPTAADAPFIPADALRRLDTPGLQFKRVARIQNQRHRVTFYKATWEGGSSFVRDVEISTPAGWVRATAEDRRLDEQWAVLTSDEPASASYFYGNAETHWVAFDRLRQLDSKTVELRAKRDGVFDLTVRWTLSGPHPELHYVLTAKRAQHFIVAYQSTDCLQDADVNEVLCGPIRHAKVIGGPSAVPNWELFAPVALIERPASSGPLTTGVYVPADVIAFEHERALGPDNQPFGMSLRNDVADVQPVAYAPHGGRRSELAAGQKVGYAFAFAAFNGALYDAYVDIARSDFEHTAYRENVFGTSLTQTAFNLLNLAALDPDADDSETFQPSFSGWWSRGKGFADVEGNQAVRTPTAGVVLSAQYLTCPPDQGADIYDRRARPLLEYQVSRRQFGTTPVLGQVHYGDAGPKPRMLGGVAMDASTLVPLYRQTYGQNAALHRLAMDSIRTRPLDGSRPAMSTPLEAYLLTGDDAWLAEAMTRARRLIRTQIDIPYTTNGPEVNFAIQHAKDWIELVVLYEMTGDKDILAGAHREAKRFVTEIMMRKVPRSEVTVPNTVFVNNQYDGWNGHVMPAYPKSTVEPEQVPAWMVSTSGLTFEQLTTYRSANDGPDVGGGFVLNAIWAPFMLRLGHYVGDSFLSDVAHNQVVGRFTNYPAYYNRQFIVAQMKPDYPLQGPPGVGSIYFHHIPAQLGLTLDYLFSEHFVRSKGKVSFPSEFESDYVYFRFRTYGHAAGTFYGESGVWPYLPAGSIIVDEPQLNWLSGVGNDSLYLSLTNESNKPKRATVRFDPTLTGVSASGAHNALLIRDNGKTENVKIRNGAIDVKVSPRGITAIIVRGAGKLAPWHRSPENQDRVGSSYAFDNINGKDEGIVRGMLLMDPSGASADAYIQAATLGAATLRYSVNGGAEQTIANKPHPNEWTIPLENVTDVFRYRVDTPVGTSPDRTLTFPPSITGVCPEGQEAFGFVKLPATASPGDTVRARIVATSGIDEDRDMTATLAGPAGWTISPVGTAPTRLPARGTVTWEFDVTIPTSAANGAATISGSVTTSGAPFTVQPADVELFEAMVITGLTASKTKVNPGEGVDLTVGVLNRGSVTQRRTITLAKNPGWTLERESVEVEVPGRSEIEIVVKANYTTPQPFGTQSFFSAVIGTGPKASTSVTTVDPNSIAISNHDYFPRFAQTGAWLTSGLQGPDGQQSLYSPPDVLGPTATWRPNLTQAGRYEVAVWYPSNATTATQVTYVVHHAGGDTEFTVNQQLDPRTWRVLGTFDFTAGQDGYVRLEVRVADGFTRVASARFRRL